ncbi:MAG: GxxExxY protein [Anaerolineaceae bacterium]
MNDEIGVLNELPGKYESILYKDEGYKIQGAVFEVSRELGCGFLESVYQECLEQEFTLQGIPFQIHVQYGLEYKGKKLNQFFIPDFVCYGKIIVELKAISETLNEHRAQVLNYLKMSGMRLGFLVNFGHYPKASIERIIL